MKETRKIGNLTVESSTWKDYLFFSAKGLPGQAKWDVKNEKWVTVNKEFAPRFKAQIQKAFNL